MTTITLTKEEINAIKQKAPFVLLNTQDNNNNVYLWHIQSDKELPAHDMGLNKIRYDKQGIENALDSLVGTFVYDESQSEHNKKVNPEMRGRKVAKVIDKLYCNQYGGFAKVEVFDPEFDKTMQQAIDNRNRGLPVKEGPSTELFATDGFKYGDNSLNITDFNINGLVWTDSPRDSSLGVCNIVTNSINSIMEDKNMPEPAENIVNLTKEDYDALKQKEQDLKDLQSKYNDLKPEDFKEYNELMAEKEDLFGQLVPVWTAQDGEKLEMVNSILDKTPEADKEEVQKFLEGKDLAELKIINSLNATGETPRGIQNGGIGSGRKPEDDEELTQEEYMKGLGLA